MSHGEPTDRDIETAHKLYGACFTTTEAFLSIAQALADARKEGREGRDRPGLVRDLRSFVEQQAAELALLRPLVEWLEYMVKQGLAVPTPAREALAKYREAHPQ